MIPFSGTHLQSKKELRRDLRWGGLTVAAPDKINVGKEGSHSRPSANKRDLRLERRCKKERQEVKRRKRGGKILPLV